MKLKPLNRETKIEEVKESETTLVGNTNDDYLTQINSDSGKSWKRVVIGGGSGILLGVAGVFGKNIISPTEEIGGQASGDDSTFVPLEEQEVSEEVSSSTFSYDADAQIQVVELEDDLSFSEAFAQAREAGGPGAAFEWNGGIYGTYHQDEWESMSSEEQNNFSSRAVSEANQTIEQDYSEVEVELDNEPIFVAEEEAEEELEIEVESEPIENIEELGGVDESEILIAEELGEDEVIEAIESVEGVEIAEVESEPVEEIEELSGVDEPEILITEELGEAEVIEAIESVEGIEGIEIAEVESEPIEEIEELGGFDESEILIAEELGEAEVIEAIESVEGIDSAEVEQLISEIETVQDDQLLADIGPDYTLEDLI